MASELVKQGSHALWWSLLSYGVTIRIHQLPALAGLGPNFRPWCLARLGLQPCPSQAKSRLVRPGLLLPWWDSGLGEG